MFSINQMATRCLFETLSTINRSEIVSIRNEIMFRIHNHQTNPGKHNINNGIALPLKSCCLVFTHFSSENIKRFITADTIIKFVTEVLLKKNQLIIEYNNLSYIHECVIFNCIKYIYKNGYTHSHWLRIKPRKCLYRMLNFPYILFHYCKQKNIHIKFLLKLSAKDLSIVRVPAC